MIVKLSVLELEENLLYVLYDNELLKKTLETCLELSVVLQESSFKARPLSFSLILRTKNGDKLILDSKQTEGFIQTLQTYLRLETAMEDWTFLDEPIRQLREDLPMFIGELEEVMRVHYGTISYIHPYQIKTDFVSGQQTSVFDVNNPSKIASEGWRRMVEQLRSYLVHLGFDTVRLGILQESVMEQMSQKEMTINGRPATLYTMKLLYKGKTETIGFSRYLDGEKEESKMSAVDTSSGDTTATLGDLFGLEKPKGYDFGKEIKRFMDVDSPLFKQLVEAFATVKTDDSFVGLTVSRTYEEKGQRIWVLEDGTKFVPYVAENHLESN